MWRDAPATDGEGLCENRRARFSAGAAHFVWDDTAVSRGLRFEGLKRAKGLRAGLTWDIVKQLRGITDRKILLKGIVTHEDAKLCLEQEGREHLNFSTWDELEADEREELREEVWEEVEEGEMPLWFYLPLHPEARLSEADERALQAWGTGGE